MDNDVKLREENVIVFYLQCIVMQMASMAEQIPVNELQFVSGLVQDPKGLDLWWKMLRIAVGQKC